MLEDGESVLVTGGAGYVGSATCFALHEAGVPHVVLDDLSQGHRRFVRWAPLVEGDIEDEALVRSVIEDHGVVAILHFAAKALVGESVENPELYDRWNRGKTTALVKTAEGAGVRHFVFSSTCAVYGEPERVPIDEDHPKSPTNPYGASKLACEEAIFASDMTAVALRYFNAAGAIPEEGLGEIHDPETHLIPLAVQALEGERVLKVFGRDWDTPDGTCIRDYIHVKDLASAHVAALRYLVEGGSSIAINLGTGAGTSVLEILDALERAADSPVPHEDTERRAGDPARLVADATRARAVLGWEARIPIDETVADALRFHRLERSTAEPGSPR